MPDQRNLRAKIAPSHVAVLVPSVRKAAQFLRQFDFQIGQEAVWDGEGTLEIYVEQEKRNSFLLMEPIKPGAYQRALDKRGPGLPVSIPLESKLMGLIGHIGLDQIVKAPAKEIEFLMGGRPVKMRDLL